MSLSKQEVIEKIKNTQNGIITIKIKDGKIVSLSAQKNDMQYREG